MPGIENIETRISVLLNEVENYKDKNKEYALLKIRMVTEAIMMRKHIKNIKEGVPKNIVTFGDLKKLKLPFGSSQITAIEFIQKNVNPLLHFNLNSETMRSDLLDRLHDEIIFLLKSEDIWFKPEEEIEEEEYEEYTDEELRIVEEIYDIEAMGKLIEKKGQRRKQDMEKLTEVLNEMDMEITLLELQQILNNYNIFTQIIDEKLFVLDGKTRLKKLGFNIKNNWELDPKDAVNKNAKKQLVRAEMIKIERKRDPSALGFNWKKVLEEEIKKYYSKGRVYLFTEEWIKNRRKNLSYFEIMPHETATYANWNKLSGATTTEEQAWRANDSGKIIINTKEELNKILTLGDRDIFERNIGKMREIEGSYHVSNWENDDFFNYRNSFKSYWEMKIELKKISSLTEDEKISMEKKLLKNILLIFYSYLGGPKYDKEMYIERRVLEDTFFLENLAGMGEWEGFSRHFCKEFIDHMPYITHEEKTIRKKMMQHYKLFTELDPDEWRDADYDSEYDEEGFEIIKICKLKDKWEFMNYY